MSGKGGSVSGAYLLRELEIVNLALAVLFPGSHIKVPVAAHVEQDRPRLAYTVAMSSVDTAI